MAFKIDWELAKVKRSIYPVRIFQGKRFRFNIKLNRYQGLSHSIWNYYHPEDLVLKGEIIHHKDNVKTNDWIENYEKKMTRGEHTSLHHKGISFSKDHKIKISKALKGREFPEDHRNKLSMAKKGHVTWNKGIPRTEKEKIKISIGHMGIIPSIETRLKMSISHKKAWQERKARNNL